LRAKAELYRKKIALEKALLFSIAQNKLHLNNSLLWVTAMI